MGYSKFQWFLFAFIIPLIFAIILYIVVLHALDKSLTDQLKAVGSSLPVVSRFVESTQADEEHLESLEYDVIRLSKTVEEQTEEIEYLKSVIEAKEKELADSKAKIVSLEQQVFSAENDDTIDTIKVKKTAKLLLAMSPKDAASIISEMNNEEAVTLLTTFKPDETGRILAKLDAKRASELTNLLVQAPE